MKYEKPSQTAQRLGVTSRAIQKWANDGRIPGAYKMAGSWMIPMDFTSPAEKNSNSKVSIDSLPKAQISLLNLDFLSGSSTDTINSVSNEDERHLLQAEYLYYTAKTEEASRILETYIDSDDIYLKNTACVLYLFSNLSSGHTHLVKYSLAALREYAQHKSSDVMIPELHAWSVLTKSMITILLHFPTDDLEPLEDWIRYLPEGIRLFSCYIIAHRMCLQKKYHGAHAVARILSNSAQSNTSFPRYIAS